jgi:tRNA G10  N-methylase Trm11
MATLTWYSIGIRIFGRTAVEVTRDPQAKFLAKAVADTLRMNGHEIQDVVDPFVGSGNMLYHFVKETRAIRAVGFDIDHEILKLTKRNFAKLRQFGRLREVNVSLAEGDWSGALPLLGDQATLVILAPPWGESFTENGHDLRKTEPPIRQILTTLSEQTGRGRLFAMIHTMPQVVAESVEETVQGYPTFETIKSNNPKVAARVNYVLVQIR